MEIIDESSVIKSQRQEEQSGDMCKNTGSQAASGILGLITDLDEDVRDLVRTADRFTAVHSCDLQLW